jgi:type I restriction enzyme, S subunit
MKGDKNGNLPEGWTEVPLLDLLISLESGKRPRGGVRGISEGVPSLGGEHLNAHGGFNFTNIKYVPEGFASSMRRGHLQKGDILIVKDGATTGKVALVGEGFPFDEAVANEHLFVCRPVERASPTFLANFLRSPNGQHRVLNHFQGSAQGGINKTFATGTIVPVPPLAEQRRIVERLDEIENRRASMDDHLQAARAWLKRLRKSVPTEACSGRLTAEWRVNNEPDSLAGALEKKRKSIRTHLGDKEVESQPMDTGALPDIPENWCWALLPELGEMGRGKSRHRPRNDPRLYGGDVPFIQTGDIARANGRVEHHTQTYNEEGLAQSRLWPAGTVCMTIAANIAQSAILSYPACFPDSVVGLVTDPCVALPEYVELFIRTARDDLAAYAPATAQANINLAILGRVAVPLPPVEEQAEILRLAHLMLAASDSIEAQLEYVNTVLGEATRSTFAKAFRGELVPTEAELAAEEERDYETAEELLARVADS